MELVEKCVICSLDKYVQFIDCKDYTSSQQIFSIVKCSGCGFLFTNPRPHEIDIADYYKSESYISHTGTSKGLVNRLYHIVRNYTLGIKANLIRKNNYGAHSVLDYGSGTGEFLDYMKKAGYETMGLEPSPEARLRAKESLGLTLHDNTELPTIKANHFDVITMWHVLEHVHRIGETLGDLKRALKDNGVLFIAVPNSSSYDASFYKEHWAAYDVPRHLYHFTQESMRALLAKHGLRVEKIFPMWFDSFYVSLLSSKYQDAIIKTREGSSKTDGISLWGMMEAFIIGLLSNWMGVFNKKHFSSLIYIVKKA